MCGRFTLRTPWTRLVEQFSLQQAPELPLCYNIAPTQQVAAVRRHAGGKRELALLRWGLIPNWARDPAMGARMINARGETVHEKPAFRSAFKRRRCLVLADGYYEWKKGPRKKQPYYFRRKDDRPFALAGLWEAWESSLKEDEPVTTVETCTIITTAANDLTADIHDRMPVILPDHAYDAWLATGEGEADALRDLLRPFSSELMQVQPVSTHVNSPKNDDATCIEPLIQTERGGPAAAMPLY